MTTIAAVSAHASETPSPPQTVNGSYRWAACTLDRIRAIELAALAAGDTSLANRAHRAYSRRMGTVAGGLARFAMGYLAATTKADTELQRRLTDELRRMLGCDQ